MPYQDYMNWPSPPEGLHSRANSRSPPRHVRSAVRPHPLSAVRKQMSALESSGLDTARDPFPRQLTTALHTSDGLKSREQTKKHLCQNLTYWELELMRLASTNSEL
jgi:hypothetical protein